MSPDNAIIIFTALGFAAVFLALLLGLDKDDAEQVISNISGMTPSGKREARIRRLDDMTQLADKAIQSRDMGKRMPPPLERY